MGFLSKLRDIQKGSFRPEDKRMGPGGPERERIFARGPKTGGFDRKQITAFDADRFAPKPQTLEELLASRAGIQGVEKQGIPSLPQNLDFLSRLPPNMMPEVDFSSLPKTSENLMTGMQPRMNFAFGGPSQMTQGSQHMMPDGRQMPGANHAEYEANMQRPGFVAGGPLSRAVLAKISGGAGKGINLKDIPYQGMIGTKAGLGSGKFTVNPGGLAAQARTIPSFGPTQAGMGALGVGLAADATQGFSEEASRRNMMLNSPEQFGKDLAGLKIGFDQVMQIASNKAQEIGDVTGEYVDRVSQSYSEEMENQRMQELDAQQGIKPFSLLMGPDMPFRKPEPTEGRTTSDIDDLLSSMEKKN